MLQVNSSTLFTKKYRPNYTKLYQVIDQFRDSHLKVSVASVHGVETKPIAELIKQAISQNRNAIFTFTPGPFLETNELPENWLNIPAAVGCTNQLSAFEEMYEIMNADVYAVNKQTSAYQQALLNQKKLPHILMISDTDGELEKAFNLPTFDISDQRYTNSHYFHRFTFDFRANGMRIIYIPVNPGDKMKALEHVNNIKSFNEAVIHESPIIKLK